MSNKRSKKVDPLHLASLCADMAVSAYEKQMFKSVLEKQSVEKAQSSVANDALQGSLSYLFAIFN